MRQSQKDVQDIVNPDFRIRQRPAQIIADDASVMVKGLHVKQRNLTRNDGDINLIR